MDVSSQVRVDASIRGKRCSIRYDAHAQGSQPDSGLDLLLRSGLGGLSHRRRWAGDQRLRFTLGAPRPAAPAPLLEHRKMTHPARHVSRLPAKVGIRFPPLLHFSVILSISSLVCSSSRAAALPSCSGLGKHWGSISNRSIARPIVPGRESRGHDLVPYASFAVCFRRAGIGRRPTHSEPQAVALARRSCPR
jgi:hypothetical protein